MALSGSAIVVWNSALFRTLMLFIEVDADTARNRSDDSQEGEEWPGHWSRNVSIKGALNIYRLTGLYDTEFLFIWNKIWHPRDLDGSDPLLKSSKKTDHYSVCSAFSFKQWCRWSKYFLDLLSLINMVTIWTSLQLLWRWIFPLKLVVWFSPRRFPFTRTSFADHNRERKTLSSWFPPELSSGHPRKKS